LSLRMPSSLRVSVTSFAIGQRKSGGADKGLRRRIREGE
jgi:hypothetical protein